MATGKRGKHCSQHRDGSCTDADTPSRLGGCEEARRTRGDTQWWEEWGRSSPSWCFPFPGQPVAALCWVHAWPGAGVGWRSNRGRVDASPRSPRYRHAAGPSEPSRCPRTLCPAVAPSRVAQDPVPCSAGLVLLSHSACPPSKTPRTNPPSPNQPSLPQKEASARPAAFNLLVDITASACIY